MFLPYLMGRGTPKDDPSATGSFVGLTLAADRADLVTAVLEGVAYTLRDVLEVLAKVNPMAPKLGITGGGARSALWRQIVADVLNRSLRYSDGDSCLGAAMLAAVGVGRHPTIEAACDAMQGISAETQPRPEAVAAYALLYEAYCRQRDPGPAPGGWLQLECEH
jgi:xylulokinase